MKLSNPVTDEAMTAEERKFAADLAHSYQQIVRHGEHMFSQFCSERGVPESICRRVMIQIALHRTGTNAAHEMAEALADDAAVSAENTELCNRLAVVIERQLPLSRETVKRIGPRLEAGEMPQ